MHFRRNTGIILLALMVSLPVLAQDNSGEKPDSQAAPPRSETAPAPAFGQSAPVLNPENPPLSSLDEPRLELRSAERSFISPALEASTSADTNGNNQPGASNLQSVSRILGAFDLQRFWSKSDFFAEYLGGGAFYSDSKQTVRQMHAVGVKGVTRWRTGEASLRDAFSYLPEGSFNLGAFGGVPGLGIASGGHLGIRGGGLPGTRSLNETFGAVGLTPRIGNTTLADVVQAVSPRSAVTVAGGYGFSHFTDETAGLINSQQITVQGGYSYIVNRRDQAALIYAFQQFHFPQVAGGQVDTHVVNLRWSRTITGRMNLVVSAGPQYTSIYHPPQVPGGPSSTDTHWSGSGRARLAYKFSKSTGSVSYEKYTSAGSGFFAGADTQVARLNYDRPFGRTWEFLVDTGFAYNKRIQEFTGVGTPAHHYADLFVGSVVRKQLGRDFSLFAGYHFSDLTFDNGFCQNASGTCNRITLRHVGTIGVNWHPHPVRIE